jgi:hypothetical protein
MKDEFIGVFVIAQSIVTGRGYEGVELDCGQVVGDCLSRRLATL